MTDIITYHRLTEANADRLAAADVFDHPVDPAQLAAFVASPGQVLVFAQGAERVVGFASGTVLLHPDKPPAFFVNEVDVVEEFRCRGIATALCEVLMKIARHELECEGIWLATEADNDAARALYSKLGGRQTEGIVVYDWDSLMDL
jgi:ribosomal protein S18 acetylase RimI-like enzyme